MQARRFTLGGGVIAAVLAVTPHHAPAYGIAAGPTTADEQTGPVREYGDDDGRVRLTVDRLEMGLPDRLRLVLEAEAPDTVRIGFPAVERRLGAFRVVEREAVGPLPTGRGTVEGRRAYVLEATQPGLVSVPRLEFTFERGQSARSVACVYFNRCDRTTEAGGASEHEISSGPVTVNVLTVLPPSPDLTAPREMAPPLSVPMTPRPAWMTWGPVALVALLGLAAWRWRGRRTAATAPVDEAARQAAHALALEALEALRAQDLVGKRRIEEFALRLSGILRGYLEGRFALRTPAQTTEESLRALRSAERSQTTGHEQLELILSHCDLGKFARHQPTSEEAAPVLDEAVAYVRRTADERVLVPLRDATAR